MALNKEDGGNRKFILVECEDYADTITAERVRRVINGVPGAKDASLREGLGGSRSPTARWASPIDVEGMLTGEALPGLLRNWRPTCCIPSIGSFASNGELKAKER